MDPYSPTCLQIADERRKFPNGILDQLMATFLLDYAKLLIKRFPEEAQELNNLHLKMVQKDELQKGKWGYRNLQKLTIREKTNKK